MKLKEENTRQKAQISVLKSKLEQSQRNQKSDESAANHTFLDDEKLKIIEKTLHSYQNFIDFLRDSDFGKLVDIFEMNQVQSPNATNQYEQQFNNTNMKKKHTRQHLKTKSPSPSFTKHSTLTDQQKYYSNKINKAKTKLNKNLSSGIANSSRLASSSGERIYDASMLNESAYPTSLDALVNNALDISRRLNSSSVNNNNSTTHLNKFNRKK